jgi:predicted Fe-Mo cluster-binding NifX family protein
MKVAIPVAEDRGLESSVYGHFGSAPAFVLVESETMSVGLLGNQNQAHVHGQCQPMKALAGMSPDAVIVGGIGAGALRGLRAAGIKVYHCDHGTVRDAVRLFQGGELSEIQEDDACGGHAGGHSCHH